MNNCTACRIINRSIDSNIIHESRTVICFLDHDPINLGHMLICPKEHIESIVSVSDDILLEINLIIKKYAGILYARFRCDGVSIMQNDGFFNDFGHVHFHLFPRYIDDGFSWVSKQD